MFRCACTYVHAHLCVCMYIPKLYQYARVLPVAHICTPHEYIYAHKRVNPQCV